MTSTGLYSSPRAVVDFHLLEVYEDKLLENLDHLRTPLSVSPSSLQVLLPHGLSPEPKQEMHEDDYSNELPPALRCLSVSTRSSAASATLDESCDSSSVSSVSLDDFPLDFDDTSDRGTTATAALSGRPQRSIFGSYWENKGGRPRQTQPLLSTCQEGRPTTTSAPRSEANKDLVPGEVDSYERLLERNEAPVRRNAGSPDRAAAAATKGSRRRLWENHYVSQHQSESALCEVAAMLGPPETLRKAHSTPVVGRKPTTTEATGKRASCLRQCRFSGSSRRTSLLSTSSHSQNLNDSRRSSETTVVSFSDHVEVKYLQTNTEKFAAPGWSKYFF
ncbi:expressed unknown protein [Seminavis robusta]|uniref:Uncharacterized protein n=1 Tax=Seminavis robusta TaxID=568900 RepID=A0A9N8DWN3_9STRA|nr:expressed unknown protein [Seminavis robusta]|eukprot:Sro408_g136870.1 n/a (333) ;mRNA; f:19845-20843